MKKIFSNKHTRDSAIIIAVLGILFVPHIVHAEGFWDNFLGVSDAAYTFVGWIMFLIQLVAAKFLSICGWFFNASVNISIVEMKVFLERLTVIGLIWRTIRDVSSIFFIGILIYTSIATILGFGSDVKKVIKNVIIAGLLINFSLFFTRLAVDASNAASLYIYQAMTPTAPAAPSSSGGLEMSDFLNLDKPGISDLFMDSLGVQTIYNNVKQVSGADTSVNGINIIIAGLGGTIIMIIAGVSFFIAALMFIARFAILIILMAFSPVYFVGMILPQADSFSKDWMKWLKSQLLFAPIYLFFMYITLRVISDPNFKAMFGGSTFAELFTSNGIKGSAGIIIQYVIVIVLLNAGLATAISMAGEGGKFAGKMSDTFNKWGKGKLKNTAAYPAMRILGSSAEKTDKNWSNTWMGNTRLGRSIRASTVGALAGSKFGGDTSFKDYKKEGKDMEAKDREINLKNELKNAIAHPTGTGSNIRDVLNKMTASEIAKLDKKTLINPLVIPHLDSKTYGQIDKSDRSEDEKSAIIAERNKHLISLVSSGNHAEVSKILKNVNKDDAPEIIESAIQAGLSGATPISPNMMQTLLKKVKGEHIIDMDHALIQDPRVAIQFTESQLKEMEFLPDGVKRAIGGVIDGNPLATGFDYVDRNRARWV